MSQQRICPCDVCLLLDGDTRGKLCHWCSLCQSWICEADLNNASRRALAAARKAALAFWG